MLLSQQKKKNINYNSHIISNAKNLFDINNKINKALPILRLKLLSERYTDQYWWFKFEEVQHLFDHPRYFQEAD